MASVFTQIINGDLPCYKIFEDDRVFCFLDIRPIQRGHLLIVPKIEVDHMDNLPDDIYHHLYKTAKKISLHLKSKILCKRIGQIVEGFEVAHAHLHLIPINSPGDLRPGKIKLTDDEFKEIHHLLKLE